MDLFSFKFLLLFFSALSFPISLMLMIKFSKSGVPNVKIKQYFIVSLIIFFSVYFFFPEQKIEYENISPTDYTEVLDLDNLTAIKNKTADNITYIEKNEEPKATYTIEESEHKINTYLGMSVNEFILQYNSKVLNDLSFLNIDIKKLDLPFKGNDDFCAYIQKNLFIIGYFDEVTNEIKNINVFNSYDNGISNENTIYVIDTIISILEPTMPREERMNLLFYDLYNLDEIEKNNFLALYNLKKMKIKGNKIYIIYGNEKSLLFNILPKNIYNKTAGQ